MNPFENLSNTGLEEAKDVLGGGGFTLDTGIYKGTIKAAYAGKSKNGAASLSVVVTVDNNGRPQEYRETVYVTNRQGENFYPDKTDPTKKNPLPGFTTANDIALLSTGRGLNEQTFEERVINVYSYDLKKEVPTKVAMATDMLGKDITLAIQRSTVDKTTLVGDTYVPNGETRDENTIDKAFHSESGRSVSEVIRKLPKGEFIDQWREKNTGVTRMKAKGAAGKAGVPGTPAAAANKSANLFG